MSHLFDKYWGCYKMWLLSNKALLCVCVCFSLYHQSKYRRTPISMNMFQDGGTVCILLAQRRNRNNDDPPLSENFLLKEQTNCLWETIPLAVLTVLEDWLATFQARDVSDCLGQCCPGTSWMPRSLQQWSMMIKPQRRTHERLQCGRASVSSCNYHINITTKSGTSINNIISIV